MQQLFDEFKERKEEIDCYYKFLRKITSQTYSLKNTRSNKDSCLDIRIQKILKANSFLLLYNLIESTVKNSVQFICQEIVKENVQYSDVVEGIQKQWVRVHTRQHLQSPKDEKLRDGVKFIIDKTLKDFIQFEGNYRIKYKDNVDTDVMYMIARDFGFKLDFAKSLKGGYRIGEIKDKRNFLAHGNITFSDCGQNLSMEDLTAYKNDTYRVLSKFLSVVKTYLEKKKYINS